MYIFSDESGSYGDSSYYVRSFIFLEDFKELKKINEAKKDRGIDIENELKARDNLCSEGSFDFWKDIFLTIDFKFIIVFTKRDTFRTDDYNIRKGLEFLLDQYSHEINADERKKMLTRLDIYLFQKKFEPFYFRIAKDIDDTYYNSQSKWYCDEFSGNILEGFVRELGINIFQVKSKDCLGVQLADMVAGGFRQFLIHPSQGYKKTFCKELIDKKGFDKNYTDESSKKPVVCAFRLSDHDVSMLSGINKFYYIPQTNHS